MVREAVPTALSPLAVTVMEADTGADLAVYHAAVQARDLRRHWEQARELAELAIAAPYRKREAALMMAARRYRSDMRQACRVGFAAAVLLGAVIGGGTVIAGILLAAHLL